MSKEQPLLKDPKWHCYRYRAAILITCSSPSYIVFHVRELNSLSLYLLFIFRRSSQHAGRAESRAPHRKSLAHTSSSDIDTTTSHYFWPEHVSGPNKNGQSTFTFLQYEQHFIRDTC